MLIKNPQTRFSKTKIKSPRLAAKFRREANEPPRGPLDLPDGAEHNEAGPGPSVAMSPEAVTVHQAVLELEKQGYIAPQRPTLQPFDPTFRREVEDPTTLLVELKKHHAYFDYFSHLEAIITCEVEMLERRIENDRSALREQLRVQHGSSVGKQRLGDLVRLAPHMQELDKRMEGLRRSQRLARCMVRRLQLQMRTASRRVTIVALEASHHGAAARRAGRRLPAIFT